MSSKFLSATAFSGLALVAGIAGGYRMGTGQPLDLRVLLSKAPTGAVSQVDAGKAASTVSPAAGHKIIYYRNPMGEPDTSPVPKKDSMGMDYLPVYADDAATVATPASVKPAGEHKPLYYRNPMGLADTSPIPKRDSMGMDYIPVYADDKAANDGQTVKISLDRVQRSGVRSVAAQMRRLALPVHAQSKIAMDESSLRMVTLLTPALIDKLYVNTTGQAVKAGEPLFRLVSPEIVNAELEYRIAISGTGSRQGPGIDGALRRIRNLGLPKSLMDQLTGSGDLPLSIDWPSPVTGTVIEKMVVEGERVDAGRPLFKIADLSKLWVIAEVAEQDLGLVHTGARVSLTFRAIPGETIEGRVAFVYPEVMAETRTGRIRIDLANPTGRFKPEMYAEAVIDAASSDAETITVPVDAVIDSGSQQVVIIDKGDGKFEPRPVTTGMRNQDFVEVKSGLAAGENVVTSANFLIDAESNLRAALKAFTAEPKPDPKPVASAGAAQAAERTQ